MKSVIALDLATCTGFAHSCGISGVQRFTPRRGDSPGMKWLSFRAWLERVYSDAPFDIAAYEQAHHRGGAATHSAHGFISTLEAWAAERGVELTSRQTGEIKRHATGKWKAGKDEMVAAANKRWPNVTIETDDQADALWLLDLVLTELN